MKTNSIQAMPASFRNLKQNLNIKAFRNAFKDGNISKENFSKALSSYVASLYSFDSDFDRFMRNEKMFLKM
jgi:cytochrome c peroxidase